MALRAYEEVIDFIAAGSSGPQAVAEFRPSETARARVAALLAKEKTSSLTSVERSELEHYLQLEHLMRLAKARAQQYLSEQ